MQAFIAILVAVLISVGITWMVRREMKHDTLCVHLCEHEVRSE